MSADRRDEVGRHNRVQPAYPRLGPNTLATMADVAARIARERLHTAGHGSFDEALDGVAAEAARLLRAAESLHDYPLLNADQPAFVVDFGGH
jgi:hypothetical protein